MINCRNGIVVFLGPTLNYKEACVLCDATYLPPARQSDVLLAARSKDVKTIVLIDGEFGQSLSVWHKEILFALSKGVCVLGSSSMGALRAAELARYGMIGFGRIFDDYVNGIICADDEVAVVHGPADLGYSPLSLPLINVRYTMDSAASRGEINALVSSQVVSAAAGLFFQERTIEQILRACELNGISEIDLLRIRQILVGSYVDQKAEDARGLLALVRSLPTQPEASNHSVPQFNASYCFEIQVEQDIRVMRSGGEVTSRKLAKYVGLHHPNFQDLMINASNAELVNLLAKIIGITPSASNTDKEMARIRRNKNILPQREFEEWLAVNELTEEEFRTFAERRATCRLMYNWLLASMGKRENTRLLLDELRARNEYPKWVNAAVSERKLLTLPGASAGIEHDQVPDEIGLVRSHLTETDWDIDTELETWALEAGFKNLTELYEHLHECYIARDYAKRLLLDLARPAG